MPERMRTVDVDTDAEALRLAIGRLSRRIRSQRASDELSDGQMQVLFQLDKHEPLTLTELAAFERVTAPSMNRTVAALVEGGFVERTPSPEDGRKAFLRLSSEGRATVTDTRRRRNAWFSAQHDALTPAERRALSAALPVLTKLAES